MTNFEEQVHSTFQLCNKLMLDVKEMLNTSIARVEKQREEHTILEDGENHSSHKFSYGDMKKITVLAKRIRSVFKIMKSTYLNAISMKNLDSEMMNKVQEAFVGYHDTLKSLEEEVESQKKFLVEEFSH